MSEYKKTKTDEVPILPLEQVTQDQGSPQAYLYVLAGSAIGQMFRVEQETRLGSGPKADIRLTGDGIGLEHCTLELTEAGRVRLSPLEAALDTFVNNDPVSAPRELVDGDRIRLGASTLLKLEHQDPLEQSLQKELREASLQDSLTRLGNHEYLAHRLHTEYAFASRHEYQLSLCLLDLDGFEKVNEDLGYPIGDQILQGVARLVSEAARPEDVAARPSGGTFGIIFLDLSLQETKAAAEELRQRIARHCFEGPEFSISVTASFGVATFPGGDIDSSQALLSAAQKALDAAKKAGPNQLASFPL